MQTGPLKLLWEIRLMSIGQQHASEAANTKLNLYLKSGLPGIVGYIDGTHVSKPLLTVNVCMLIERVSI